MEVQTPVSTRSSARRRAAAVAGALTAAGLAGFAPGLASASAPVDATAYCQAHLGHEAAFGSGDPAAIGPAVEAATAAAPAEIADALATAIAIAPSLEGPPPPEFSEAYGTSVDWVVDNCGFNVVDVLATEYEFGGLPEELAAGPTVVRLTNDGEEVHEIVVFQRLEGTTESIEELLALPEEEAFSKIAPVNGAVVMPGEDGAFVADLAPGNYIALCFLPVGNTPEMVAEMMAAPEGTAPMGTESMGTGMDMDMGTAPAGTEPVPHFMEGMVQEFTVVDGAAAPATTGA